MEQYYESAAEWNFEWKLGYAVNGERIPLVIQKISDSSYALCMDHWNNGPKPNPAQEKSVQRRNSVGNPDELPIFLIYYIDKFKHCSHSTKIAYLNPLITKFPNWWPVKLHTTIHSANSQQTPRFVIHIKICKCSRMSRWTCAQKNTSREDHV